MRMASLKIIARHNRLQVLDAWEELYKSVFHLEIQHASVYNYIARRM
jgi:hypothetical protein